MTTEAVPGTRSSNASAHFASLGEQLRAVKTAKVFPTAEPDPRLAAAALGLNESVPSDGGFLVPHEFTTALIDRLDREAVLLPRTFRIPISDRFNGLSAPYIDESSRATGSRAGGIRAYRQAPGDTLTASRPSFGKVDVGLPALYCLVWGTDALDADVTAFERVTSASRVARWPTRYSPRTSWGCGDGCGRARSAMPGGTSTATPRSSSGA